LAGGKAFGVTFDRGKDTVGINVNGYERILPPQSSAKLWLTDSIVRGVLIIKEGENRWSVEVDGCVYGPYQSVGDFFHSSDGANFGFLYQNNDNKLFLNLNGHEMRYPGEVCSADMIIFKSSDQCEGSFAKKNSSTMEFRTMRIEPWLGSSK
jgi:hypothetical protein